MILHDFLNIPCITTGDEVEPISKLELTVMLPIITQVQFIHTATACGGTPLQPTNQFHSLAFPSNRQSFTSFLEKIHSIVDVALLDYTLFICNGL